MQQYLQDFENWLARNPAHDVQVSRLLPLEKGVQVIDANLQEDPEGSTYRIHDPTTGQGMEVVGRAQTLETIQQIRGRLFRLMYAPVLDEANKAAVQGVAPATAFQLKNN